MPPGVKVQVLSRVPYKEDPHGSFLYSLYNETLLCYSYYITRSYVMTALREKSRSCFYFETFDLPSIQKRRIKRLNLLGGRR